MKQSIENLFIFPFLLRNKTFETHPLTFLKFFAMHRDPETIYS